MLGMSLIFSKPEDSRAGDALLLKGFVSRTLPMYSGIVLSPCSHKIGKNMSFYYSSSSSSLIFMMWISYLADFFVNFPNFFCSPS